MKLACSIQRYARIPLATAIALVLCSVSLAPAQSNSVVTAITSPVQTLDDTVFGGTTGDPNNPVIDTTKEPYYSGKLAESAAAGIIAKLGGDASLTTIIHILRWGDVGHTKSKFDKWYIYDPQTAHNSFYFPRSAEFTGTSIPGRTNLQLIYIHLNYDLTTGESEWKQATAGSPPKLIHPVSYSVTVTQAQTQFLQDLKSILPILGFNIPAANHAPSPGYFALSNITSQWTTSTITVTASLDSGNKNANSQTTNQSTKLASRTFTNEKPSWIGFSAGVQITSYKDVTYQSSSGTVIPSSITSKDVYLFFDGYVPPVVPGLRLFRYIPNPTFGMPIKGKVLRHTMLGGAIGLKWIEPYGGVVFDTENQQVKGTTHSNSLTIQPVFGLKISITAAAKALKGK
jgi:hypothetical protein